jgi:predicted transcriptional regulator
MTPLSTTDAAELLGVSTRMVRLYIEEGLKTHSGALKLKAALITKRMYLIDPKDLEKFKIMRTDLNL